MYKSKWIKYVLNAFPEVRANTKTTTQRLFCCFIFTYEQTGGQGEKEVMGNKENTGGKGGWNHKKSPHSNTFSKLALGVEKLLS